MLNRKSALCLIIVVFFIRDADSREWRFESDVDARAEYDDNIFLTSVPHDSITSMRFTPEIKGVVKEEHWQTDIAARLRSNRYSDSRLNSDDKYFDLTGAYNNEKNILSINIDYDFDSNLNYGSPDFGIVGRRVNRKQQSVSPRYTYLATERFNISLSYSYTDVDYIDAESTGYTPYITQSGVASFIYALSEKDRFTFSMTAVDYASKNDLLTYRLFMPRFGVDHEFSEVLSLSFSAGSSRRNSTNLSTQSFDFFGQPITLTREVDFTDKGFVLDAGLTQKLETGKIIANITRDNTTNSFGGLNQVDRYKLRYNNNISELLHISLMARYEDYSAISSGSRNTDRQVAFFESAIRYTIARNWDINASYRYIKRRFKGDTSGNNASYSNRIYAGLTYNFPTLSTF